MCGGIAAALSHSLPLPVRQQRWRLLLYLVSYSGGRLLSYLLIGSLLGASSGVLLSYQGAGEGHAWLQWGTAIVMSGIGLHIAGWFPRFNALERLGLPLWRQLQPLSRRLLPVRSLPAALLYGAIWGWLPCGLVYSVALWSLTSGSAGAGGLLLLLFGVGTLPAVVATGILAARIQTAIRHRLLRPLAGISLILLAWFGLLLADPLPIPTVTETPPICHD